MIEKYDFGVMVVNGKRYTNDVIIIRGKIRPDWWRKQGHLLQNADLSEVYNAKPKKLIVGTGYSGVMKVSEEVREECRERGIELVEMKTADAVKKFNELSEKEKNIAGAFHLTC